MCFLTLSCDPYEIWQYEPLCYFKENPERDCLWRSMYVVKIKHKLVLPFHDCRMWGRQGLGRVAGHCSLLQAQQARLGRADDFFCWETQLSLQEPCNYQSPRVSSQGTIYRHIIKIEISIRRHSHFEGTTIKRQIRWSRGRVMTMVRRINTTHASTSWKLEVYCTYCFKN